MPETYHLLLDTSEATCSAAISVNARVVASCTEHGANLHAERLTTFINQVVTGAGLRFADLSSIVVSNGPGSYTGLRIGISTAKGLAFALNIPIIALDTLHIWATAYTMHFNNNCNVAVMLDARRMEVYCGVYSSTGKSFAPPAPLILTNESLTGLQTFMPLAVTGSGAAKILQLHNPPPFNVYTGPLNLLVAMAHLGLQGYNNGTFADTAYFEPVYLKEYTPTQSRRQLL